MSTAAMGCGRLGYLLYVLLLSAMIAPSFSQSYYSFCYTLSSNLLSSPIFPFSIAVSGSLNVSAAISPSQPSVVQVTAAVGQRSVVYQGQTHPVSIAAIAAPQSYLGNDNVLSLSPPFLSSPHALAFVFAAPAYSAYGMGGLYGAVYNDSVYGLSEDTTPPSDGAVASVLSSFSLQPSAAFTANVSCSAPAVPAPTASQLSLLTSTVSYSYCYAFTGGPGDSGSASSAAIWTISTIGSLTTSGFTGTVNGQSAAVITNVTGTRVYTDTAGQAFSSRLSGVAAANSLLGQAASNMLYLTYPYFDHHGALFTALGSVSSAFTPAVQSGPPASSALVLLSIDYYNIFDETIFLSSLQSSPPAGFLTPVGSLDLALSSAGTASLQCAFNAGAAVSYAFCYSLVQAGAGGWSVQTYGVVSATGPVLREGRAAVTLQSMTGVRVMVNGSGSYAQNVIRLLFINGDALVSNDSILNDNEVYLSAPPLDYYGIEFALSSPALFPNYSADIADLNLAAGGGTMYEWPGDYVGLGVESSNAAFNLSAWSGGAASFPCSAAAVPPSQPLYFCYTAQSSSESLSASGTLWLYGTTVTAGGRAALAVQSATGSRMYQSSSGVSSTVAITGVSADAFGAANFSYDLLLFSSPPLLDSKGLLFTLAPGALVSGAAAITGRQVVHVATTADRAVVEEAIGVHGMVALPVNFTVSSSPLQCSVTTGSSGSGGGLSHGDIAGIVIGSVVGGLLLLTLALLALRAASNRAQEATTVDRQSDTRATGAYEVQRQPSVSTRTSTAQLA